MTPSRRAFLIAAESAARLLADPAVAEHWAALSALPEYRVSGLAGHLALQVRHPARMLGEAPPTGRPDTLDEYYAAADWIGAGVDAEPSVDARLGGERSAADGPRVLADAVAALVRELAVGLPSAPLDRLVHLPWADRVLTLDDFLLTRTMEIAVHSDDLAVSVGVPTPALPADVAEPVLHLLTRLATARHGVLPVLRALSRRERAPDDIAAF
jgi:hypothetical protein